MTQHGGKLLGYNMKNLHLLNLQNVDSLYDTYQIYINELKKYLRPTLDSLGCKLGGRVEASLDRSLLKNLIMTAEYGVTYYTAYREFLQTLDECIKDDEVRAFLSSKPSFNVIY